MASESNQNTLEELFKTNLIEQRKKRRWAIFFKFVYLIIILFLLKLIIPFKTATAKNAALPHVGIIDIRGTLVSGATESPADNFASSLQDAFKDKNTLAVIVRINSPGGSPVQATYIYDEIRRQAALNQNRKIYAVCTDVCASAAYFIASAADQIYASPATLVGSIGVLMDNFGFVDSLKKVGAERRLFTAGSHKAFLDPFSPLKPEDTQIAQRMLDDVHQLFIRSVREGRGNRLKETPDIFSGLTWTGSQALNLGLIDGLGSSGYVAREIIRNTNFVDYTIKPNYFVQLANRVGASFAQAIDSSVLLRHLE